MNIAVLGTGIVGETIASRLVELGHVVRMGSRTANNDKAAAWAASQAVSAGGTLQGYLSAAGAGDQYASYWTQQEVQQADANEQAKQQGP
jgi:predicted dinucleotide-binding enzyme